MKSLFAISWSYGSGRLMTVFVCVWFIIVIWTKIIKPTAWIAMSRYPHRWDIVIWVVNFCISFHELFFYFVLNLNGKWFCLTLLLGILIAVCKVQKLLTLRHWSKKRMVLYESVTLSSLVKYLTSLFVCCCCFIRLHFLNIFTCTKVRLLYPAVVCPLMTKFSRYLRFFYGVN